MDNEVWKKKQEWLAKVMGSDLTPAVKVFAWTVFSRCYGDKIDCFPDSEVIMKDGGWNTHQALTAPRKKLIDSGAVSAVKQSRKDGRYPNYTYTLNLDWEPPCNMVLPTTQHVVAGTMQHGVAYRATWRCSNLPIESINPKLVSETIKGSDEDSAGAPSSLDPTRVAESRTGKKFYGYIDLGDSLSVLDIRNDVASLLVADSPASFDSHEGQAHATSRCTESDSKMTTEQKLALAGW